MLKRRQLGMFIAGTLLGVSALSGCEKLDSEEEPPAESQDVSDADDADATTDSSEAAEAESEEPDSEDQAPDADAEPDPENAADPADSDSDPDPGSAGNFEALPTEHCPIDIPAPFMPHDLESEEPGDGVDVFCIAHVISKGDPEALYGELTEQFSDLGASQLEDNPSPNPETPGELSIQSWQIDDDHEIIINITNMSLTQNELIYVVRSTSRHG